MADGHGDLVRRGYEAWNEGDRSWVLEHMSPDIEWITPPDDPDPGTFRGYEGVERFWASWREFLGHLQFEVEEVEEFGSHVLVCARRLGIGEQSGIEIEERVFQLFTFGDDDRCVRVQEFYDRTEATTVARAGISGRN
jgi:ketosteroid isomerase-like protein